MQHPDLEPRQEHEIARIRRFSHHSIRNWDLKVSNSKSPSHESLWIPFKYFEYHSILSSTFPICPDWLSFSHHFDKTDTLNFLFVRYWMIFTSLSYRSTPPSTSYLRFRELKSHVSHKTPWPNRCLHKHWNPINSFHWRIKRSGWRHLVSRSLKVRQGAQEFLG
jgi:hypothetical protein